MVNTVKKQAARSEKSADHHRVTGTWVKHIEKMSDLGQGYVLVKLKNHVADLPGKRQGPSARAGSTFETVPPGVPKISPTRALQVLNELSRRLGNSSVGARRASGTESLARREARENDQFMEDLRAQELANRKRDIEEGHLLTSTALAERLEIKTQALSKAVGSQRMFTLDGPSGRKFYPAFFAHPGIDRERIETVCQALGSLPGPSKWEFFTSPRESLKNMTPIDALGRGMLTQVLRAATAFVER